MNFKNSTAEKTTITRNTDEMEVNTGNIYESIVMMSKRSNQLSIDPKITNRIWKNMIWSFIDYEKRNFKKK